MMEFEHIYQELADEKGLTLEEYNEFSAICYQHTQGYFKDAAEKKTLMKRYHELIKIGKERLK